MGLFDKLGSGGKKKEAFYDDYADSHGLTRSQEPFPPVTKSLSGHVAIVERFDGKLSTRFRGSVALVETTVVTKSQLRTTDRDASINTWLPEGTETQSTETSSKAHPGTIVQVSLGKVPQIVGGLAVKRNYDKQSMGQNDAYGDLGRLVLSGTALGEDYFVFVDQGSDPEAVRALFTPAVATLLNSRPGKFFGFEVGGGSLVTKTPGKHPRDAGQLDALVDEACEIARVLEDAAG